MQAPLFPENESERLQVLLACDILDTPQEERFDRLTRLAQQMFGVQIALVSIVDADRQWFKSRQGLDACETGRDISFCGHAILAPEVFNIPDASCDSRFADNPLVTGPPYIRFYAGAPLSTSAGQRIGTLCIIDDKPKTLSLAQIASLRDLADCVEQEIFQQYQQRQHTALLTLTKIISLPSSNFHSLLQDALKLACDYLDLSYGIISHIQGDDYIVQVHCSPKDTLRDGQHFSLGQTYCSITMQANAVLAIDDMQSSEYVGHPCYQHFRLESYIGIPLYLKGKPYGTLNFSDPRARQSRRFNEVEIDFVRLLADWTNSAIHQAELDGSLKRQLHLSDAITRAQSQFIGGKQRSSGFDALLTDMLALTMSEYGFIGEVRQDASGTRYLKSYAVNHVAWNDVTRANENTPTPGDKVISALQTLVGTVMATGTPMIVNNAPADLPRDSGQPGDLAVEAFLGIPVYRENELVAMIGLANRAAGYDQAVIEFLHPLLVTIGQLVKAAKVQLQHLDSERHLADVIRATNIGTWEWNIQTGAVVFNERWADILGYTLAELAPVSLQTWLDQVHPDDLKHSQVLLEQHFSGTLDYYDLQCRMRHKDGHWVWVHDRGCLISRTDDDKPLLMSGSHLDISQQKKYEEQLLHTYELLEQSNDAAHIGTWELDFEVMQPYWSRVTRQIHEVSADYRCQLDEAIHFYKEGESRDTLEKLFSAAVNTGTPYDVELIIVTAKGNEKWVRVIGLPQFVEGKCRRVYGTFQDISERKRLERIKTEFISTVSHELRTPLTSISGALGLILGGVIGEVPEKIQKMLNIAHKNSLRLTFLINDLLDMEKLAAGKMQFEWQVQALAPLLEQSVEANVSYGSERKVSLALINAAPTASVNVDGQRLMQVLSNLLSNAIKYSPENGEVMVSAELNHGKVRVSVADHGPGIPIEFRERIFQKFAQADSSDTRQKGGSGLGLAISRELIERMGGQIGFESDAGRGANFYFDLPVLVE